MNFDSIYLLDTVTVSKMSRTQLQSEFVQTNCKLPEEVRYELRDNPNLDRTASLELPASIDILESIHEQFRDTRLESVVDLYNFKGNGDMILLAVAVVENQKSESELFRTNWIIVTDDGLLTTNAALKGVMTLTTEEFLEQHF